MKVTLVFDAQFCGRMEATVELPEEVSDEEIKALFPERLGIDFDENCYWTVDRQ